MGTRVCEHQVLDTLLLVRGEGAMRVYTSTNDFWGWDLENMLLVSVLEEVPVLYVLFMSRNHRSHFRPSRTKHSMARHG